MTKVNEKHQLQGTIKEFCAKKGISQVVLANMVGVSNATISNIENGKFNLLSDVTLTVWDVIKPSDKQLVETYNFNVIYTLCDDARKGCKMLAAIGYTGAGKTTAFKEYFRENKNTYYVVCKKSMSPKQFFAAAARAIGLNPADVTGNVHVLIETIAAELNAKHNLLLIIDEAGKLSQTMFMYLHDLRESTLSSTGIVLAGVEYFHANMNKWVAKGKQGMAEFNRRVMHWQYLQRPTKKEVAVICKSNGIDNEEIIKGIYEQADNFGTVDNLITNYLLSQQMVNVK